MRLKLAVAGALLGCQFFALAAGARGVADKRIDQPLQAPLQKLAQMDGAGVPNGLPYVPPDERQATSSSPFGGKAAGRGRRGGGRRHGGKHHKRLSSAHRRNQTAAASGDQSSCCAAAPAEM